MFIMICRSSKHGRVLSSIIFGLTSSSDPNDERDNSKLLRNVALTAKRDATDAQGNCGFAKPSAPFPSTRLQRQKQESRERWR